jgi:hypothetical protein
LELWAKSKTCDKGQEKKKPGQASWLLSWFIVCYIFLDVLFILFAKIFGVLKNAQYQLMRVFVKR